MGQVQTIAHYCVMVTHSSVDHAWLFLTCLSRSVVALRYHLFH